MVRRTKNFVKRNTVRLRNRKNVDEDESDEEGKTSTSAVSLSNLLPSSSDVVNFSNNVGITRERVILVLAGLAVISGVYCYQTTRDETAKTLYRTLSMMQSALFGILLAMYFKLI